MRLSDVKGDRTLEVVADLIEPIANIAQDKDAAEMFKVKAVPDGMTQVQFFAERLKTGLPVLLKSHKGDVVAILATIEGVTPEEYGAELNLAKLVIDVSELLNDEAFVGFLASSQTEKTKDAVIGQSDCIEDHSQPE